MQKAKPAFVYKSHGVQEHVFGFGWEAGDKIGTENGFRSRFSNFVAKPDGVLAAMAPLHSFQNQIIAGLKAEMKMGHHPRLFGHYQKQCFIHLGWING